jgi:hypothetical protein
MQTAHTVYQSGFAFFDTMMPGPYFKAMTPYGRIVGYSPIHFEQSSQREWKLTSDLEEFLDKNGAFEDDKGLEKRYYIGVFMLYRKQGEIVSRFPLFLSATRSSRN